MISDVRLQNFRSYKDSSFEFEPGVNIVVGPNASGKTNLLEALLVLCRGKSYRNTDQDLVRFEAPWSRLDMHVGDHERSVLWQPKDDRFEKSFLLDGNKKLRLSHTHTVPVVLFEPNHLQLLTSSPSLRRDFIDGILEQTIPTFSTTRNYYKRAITQRNHLLRTAASRDDMFVWDVRVSELGGQIIQARKAFIEKNSLLLQDFYTELAGKEQLAGLDYVSNLAAGDEASSLLKALQSRYVQDKERGFTTVGPHRDDIIPNLNNHELPSAGSRGETRTMLLALKLLEVKAVEQARGQKPILLLDDVFSELDGARRKALTEHLKDHQAFITTTDADIVTKNFTRSALLVALGSN